MNDLSLTAELRNVEWELYMLYQSGDAERLPFRVESLWSELDRLEALLVLGE